MAGGTGGILFEDTQTHIWTHTQNILMQLTDADLVHGQVPGLSALVPHTQTHTHTCIYTQIH